MRKDKSSSWVSWAELITPGRAILIVLVLVSPAIVVFYASLVHSWYFSEAATPKPATLSWRLKSEPQLCETLATSGMWVTLKCREQTTVAPIAGFELPSDEKDTKNLQPALDQLWSLTSGRNAAAKVACELVSVSTTDGSLPSLPFARCRIGGRNVTELLASLGVPLAPKGSPARSTLDRTYQKYADNRLSTAASAKPDPAKEVHRSTALALQGWVATLLGFVGAAIGVIYSGHERAARARNRRRLSESAYVIAATFCKTVLQRSKVPPTLLGMQRRAFCRICERTFGHFWNCRATTFRTTSTATSIS
jgi:hypothetical protein